ncbi:MAG: hypothetical protein HRU75_12710 [Planctomycetia bacterium]|nr:MAG: hypothetical protein HRU75_12710 [Planctomycetia bacterium]
MTSRDCVLLSDALTALREGRFEALTPDAVAAAEAHLNTCAACAGQLGAVRPASAGDPLVRAAPSPLPVQWRRAWSAIADRSPASSSIWRGGRAGILRSAWTPLAAAAACVMMVVSWRLAAPPVESGLWSLAAAGDVRVLEMDVGDGVTAMVGDGPTVVWILEPEMDAPS